MSITLNPEVEDRIRQKVEGGRYHSADEVIEEALALLDDHERWTSTRAKLQSAAEQLDRGLGVEWTPELVKRLQLEGEDMYRRGERPDPDVCPHP